MAKKLSMPSPYIGSTSPESSLYQASDDAMTLARAHEVMRNPARMKGLKVHIDKIGGLLKKGSLKSAGVKR